MRLGRTSFTMWQLRIEVITRKAYKMKAVFFQAMLFILQRAQDLRNGKDRSQCSITADRPARSGVSPWINICYMRDTEHHRVGVVHNCESMNFG